MKRNRKNVLTGSIVSLLSTALASLGMISVCGFPLLASFLAWFGIGASQLSFLSDYQYLLKGIAIIALVYAFYVVYFKKNKSDINDDPCNTKTNSNNKCKGSFNYIVKSMLWLASIAIILSFFVGNDNKSNISTNAEEVSTCDYKVKTNDFYLNDTVEESYNSKKESSVMCNSNN